MSEEPPRDQTSPNDGKDDRDLSVSFCCGSPLPFGFTKITRRGKCEDHGKHDEETSDDDCDSHYFFVPIAEQGYVISSILASSVFAKAFRAIVALNTR